jgi:hypothetical protein
MSLATASGGETTSGDLHAVLDNQGMVCQGSWMVAFSLIVLALLAGPLWSATAEERGDQAWQNRANGFLDRHVVGHAPSATAVAAYEEALEAEPDNLRLHFKLMEALYFEAFFASNEPATQQQTAEQEVALAARALALIEAEAGGIDDLESWSSERQARLLEQAPEVAQAHFWAAVSWGLWGMSHSHFASARHGVAKKIRDHARAVITLDQDYADAGGLRLLGRLYTVTPKVPFVTGWIDRREGLALLRRAVTISRRDPRNLLFLAEAILEYEPDSRTEALDLLREVAAREPAPDALVEQSETLERARELIAGLR